MKYTCAIIVFIIISVQFYEPKEANIFSISSRVSCVYLNMKYNTSHDSRQQGIYIYTG